MNKIEFIKELKIKLRKLPSKELDDAISYYNEYFEDAQIDDSVNVENELGSPSTIASQILSDYAVKDVQIKDNSSKNKFSSVGFIILAIFASPIALPLTFAMVVVVLSLLFATGTVIFAFGISSASILFSGILVFICGILSIITEFSSSLLFIGAGLFLSGLGLLAFLGTINFGNLFLKLIVTLSSKYLKKANKINNKEMI